MEDKLNGWHTDNYGIRRHFRKGVVHREDGPAIIYLDGSKQWYVHHRLTTMEDVLDTPEKREAYLLEESLRKL
jgi:hypothetical protein